MEALRKNSRKRWLPEVADSDALMAVAALVADINLAHSARNATAASEMFVARLLLARFQVDEIFKQAQFWIYSNETREAVRYNGAIGIVDLTDRLTSARESRLRNEETAQREREADEWARKRASQ